MRRQVIYFNAQIPAVESRGTRHVLPVLAEVGMDEIMTAPADGRTIREFSYGPQSYRSAEF